MILVWCVSENDVGQMDYWHILVLASVRLGCNLKYDRLQDPAENHRRLRGIMGIGDWDEKTSFCWQRITENVRPLSPATIDAVSAVVLFVRGSIIRDEPARQVRPGSSVFPDAFPHPLILHQSKRAPESPAGAHRSTSGVPADLDGRGRRVDHPQKDDFPRAIRNQTVRVGLIDRGDSGLADRRRWDEPV